MGIIATYFIAKNNNFVNVSNNLIPATDIFHQTSNLDSNICVITIIIRLVDTL